MTTLLRRDPISRFRWNPFKDRNNSEDRLAPREMTGNRGKESLAVAQRSNGMSCPHCSSVNRRRSVRHGGRDFSVDCSAGSHGSAMCVGNDFICGNDRQRSLRFAKDRILAHEMCPSVGRLIRHQRDRRTSPRLCSTGAYAYAKAVRQSSNSSTPNSKFVPAACSNVDAHDIFRVNDDPVPHPLHDLVFGAPIPILLWRGL